MAHRRVTKNEIDLCFERMLVDARDDFFPDPFCYADLKQSEKEIKALIIKTLNNVFKKLPLRYQANRYYDWDVPKNNYVVRQGYSLHPLDVIAFHFILNRLIPKIEPNLSPARYSYKIHNMKSKYLFSVRPTEDWIRFKNDIKLFFNTHTEYEYLVSTDIAGFFEHIPIRHFKDHLVQISAMDHDSSIELLQNMLKQFSSSEHSGIPQNCDPFSYLCTAFLDYLDKELEALGIKHFRYSDDIRVACKTENDAKRAIVQIIRSLRKTNLNLSPSKTEIVHKSNIKYKEFVKDFPKLLSDVDSAVHYKSKSKIVLLYPKIIELTCEVMKNKDFDDKLFRACIWRIIKINKFKNIPHHDLDSIGRKCLKLLKIMPQRSDTFIRFLNLHKDRKYVQDSLYELLQDCVYPWQEMWIWSLLIQCTKCRNNNIFSLAKERLRDKGYDEAARNYIIIFLGKHGDYHDRQYIAQLLPFEESFRCKRCILIGLQEYQDKSNVYNKILTDRNGDLVLVSLVKYLKQLKEPEYIAINKIAANETAFS